eukprot:scaffold370_cov349-Pavlova_lutheri.AAC.29
MAPLVAPLRRRVGVDLATGRMNYRFRCQLGRVAPKREVYVNNFKIDPRIKIKMGSFLMERQHLLLRKR